MDIDMETDLCKALASSLHFKPDFDVFNKKYTDEILEASQNQTENETNDTMEIESTKDIVFYPPVGIQRYLKTREVLEALIGRCDPNLLKSVLEVGCGRFRLHTYMKRLHESVQKLIYMDIDIFALQYAYKEQLSPFCFEYLIKRSAPLVVEAYAGDITKCDPRILNLDPNLFCVIAIEVIEHLYPEVLEGFEKSVFGVLRPPAVILTTPNAEFNTVFRLPPGAVRHWDHKFEWTRLEFKDWCDKICREYPGYQYETLGIGQGPPGTEVFGCVSQLAVFTLNPNIPAALSNHDLNGIVEENCYKLITHIEYPYAMENTTKHELILKEFECYVTMYVLNPSSVDHYIEEDLTEIILPLDKIVGLYGMPKDVDKGEIVDVLTKAGKNIRLNADGSDGVVVLPVPKHSSRSWPSSDEEDEDSMKDSGMDEPNKSQDSVTYENSHISDEDW